MAHLRPLALVALLALVASALIGCHALDPAPPGDATKAQSVQPADFDQLVGEPMPQPWRGTLTYRDYTTNKPTSIRANLLVTRSESQPESWTFSIAYPDEPHADNESSLSLSSAGDALFSGGTLERVVLRERVFERVRILTEHEGQDDNAPATIRREFLLSPNEYIIRKSVKPAGKAVFIGRNEYRWTR